MKYRSPHIQFTIVFTLLLSLFTLPSRAAAPHRPAMDIFVYRRSHTADERVKLRLSAFNQTKIEFTAYRLSLPRLVATSRSLETLPKTLKTLDLQGLPQVRRWTYGMGKTYPD